MLKKFIIFTIVFSVLMGTLVAILDKEKKIESPPPAAQEQSQQSAQPLPQQSISPSTTAPSAPAKKTLIQAQPPISQSLSVYTSYISERLDAYKMPLPSGNWRSCVAGKINAFTNVQLLLFYEWFKSLSPYASEATQLVGIARQLGCPEPVVKTIPAKVELLKSWSGIGAKSLEKVSNIPSPWQLTGSWSQKETVGITDAEAPYGVFICQSDNRYETCSLLSAGFFGERTFGNFYGVSDQYDFLQGAFYLKVEPNPSDLTPSWSLRLEKVLEPAKTFIE